MKLINKLFLSVLLVAVLAVACDTDKLHELNINPNAVSKIDLNYVLTAAQLGSAAGGSAGDNRYIDWRTNIGMCAYAIQQLGHIAGGIAPGDKYTDNPESNNAPFEFLMGDVGKNTALIIKQTGPGGYAEGKNNNLRQATRILRVFNFHRLTDYYGNVPYSEANKGLEGIFYPVYDNQESIYKDLLKELDEASAALSASDPAFDQSGFSRADLIYKGDVAKWKKWGYSLMLRLAMRVSYVDAALANTYVTKAIAGGVFTSNSDNVWIPMAVGPSQWTNQNGISRAFYPGDGGQPSYLSKVLIDWLKGTNAGVTTDDDPRLMIMSGGIGKWLTSGFTPEPGGTDPLNQKGLPNGNDQSQIDALEGKAVVQETTFSRINPKLLDLNDPYMLMNYGEVKLLLAEAANRGIGGATGAQAHYDEGVKASMQMYTPFDASFAVSDAAVTTYLTTYPYVAGATGLRKIGEQVWANKFMNWWEAWSDWRRTGFPLLTPTNYVGNLTGGKIPTKLTLPSAEVAGNPNYATGATQPDLLTGKVWWDVKD